MEIFNNKSKVCGNNRSLAIVPFYDIQKLITILYNNEAKWIFNRDVNSEHVQSIKQGIISSIKDTGTFDFCSNIIMVNEKNTNKFKIIDGQHRFQALRELIEDPTIKLEFDEEPEFNFTIYHIDNIEDNIKINQLFHVINNTLKVSEKVSEQNGVLRLIEQLSKNPHWKDSKGVSYIRDNQAHRPYLNMKKLSNALKENKFEQYLAESIKEKQNDKINQLIEIIKQKNDDLSKRTIDYFYKKPTKTDEDAYKDAQHIGFFLALDKNFGFIRDISEQLIILEERWEIDEKLICSFEEGASIKVKSECKFKHIKKLETIIKENLKYFRTKFADELKNISKDKTPTYLIKTYTKKVSKQIN